jgi:phosphoribosylpyrophosphate synthetase
MERLTSGSRKHSGHDVFIIQPTCPPTNQHLMELLIMVDAARRASADRITAVIPFLATAPGPQGSAACADYSQAGC